jgi:hypothetical protein
VTILGRVERLPRSTQEDVEEVQDCSLDLHYDLPRFRQRVSDFLQLQGLFRTPKLAYPPGYASAPP